MPTEMELLEAELADIELEKMRRRVAKARQELETIPIIRPRVVHSSHCMIDLDPEYYGPCTCGAATSSDGKPSRPRYDDDDI